MAIFNVQKISTTNKTIVAPTYDNFNSVVFTNTHATADITIDLYITSQVGTDIADTDTNVNFGDGYSTTTSSQAIVVDNGGTAGTSDMFLNEKVYLSTGVLVGTCTTFGSATSLTFSGGLASALVDDASLYTGTRYHVLNNVKIPNGVSLKLMSDEIKFNSSTHTLYINSDNAAGAIDIITRY